MIDVDDAKQYVLGGLTALDPVELSLVDALGCVASEEARAREAVPGFTNSSMDGFALRAADAASGPVTLIISGSLLAGDAPSSESSRATRYES